MRLSKEKTKELIEAVRREIVRNPNTTIQEIQQNLNIHYGHIFDKNFVGKLKNKIHRERFCRYNIITVKHEIAKFEDTIEELCNLLWKIIDDEQSTRRERINAIREIRSAKSVLLETMFDSGVFEVNEKIQKADEPLSLEELEKINRAIEFALTPRMINTSENDENML
jgi:hypothetical protein